MSTPLKIAGAIIFAAYPIAIWAGLSLTGNRAVSLTVLAVLAVFLPFRYLNHRLDQFREFMGSSVSILVLVLLSIVLDDRRFLLSMPVLVNAVLLFGFGISLSRNRMPVVERFARLVHKELSPERALHCRAVTRVWCLFFAMNGLISLWLALFAPLKAWVFYTGGIAYLLMGALFLGEYVIRRIRFG